MAIALWLSEGAITQPAHGCLYLEYLAREMARLGHGHPAPVSRFPWRVGDLVGRFGGERIRVALGVVSLRMTRPKTFPSRTGGAGRTFGRGSVFDGAGGQLNFGPCHAPE